MRRMNSTLEFALTLRPAQYCQMVWTVATSGLQPMWHKILAPNPFVNDSDQRKDGTTISYSLPCNIFKTTTGCGFERQTFFEHKRSTTFWKKIRNLLNNYIDPLCVPKYFRTESICIYSNGQTKNAAAKSQELLLTSADAP